MGMSAIDVLELNQQYKCESSIAFMLHCDFSCDVACPVTTCSNSPMRWEKVTNAFGGPSSDHTGLTSGNAQAPVDNEGGYFMHVSTAEGETGDSAWLETKRMNPKRKCITKCLQFYYYHSNSESNVLNVWIREFKDEQDFIGRRRLVEKISGPLTRYWQIKYVPIETSKFFQVEFEVRKGPLPSTGGISIDDINLSELQCPHGTIQINNLQEIYQNSQKQGYIKYSPNYYSTLGYAYSFGVSMEHPFIGVFIQLVSGKYDEELTWPVPDSHVTLQVVDQSPNIQSHMSYERSLTSHSERVNENGTYLWGKPEDHGTYYIDDYNQVVYYGPKIGFARFYVFEQMYQKHFLKGGSAVFNVFFEDVSPLNYINDLPCPPEGPNKYDEMDKGSCSPKTWSTAQPPLTTHNDTRTTEPDETTDDKSVFDFAPHKISSPVLIVLGAQMQEIPEIALLGEEKRIEDINKGLMVDDIKMSNVARSSILPETSLWSSPVPYVLENDLDLNAKGVILKAFDQFRLKSCIDFKPREQEEYYISVQKLDGCWSYIGRTKTNGQELSIGQNCDTIATVEHEFFHALGFYHEQSRYDRDDFVTIHLENVLKGYENNFLKVSSDESTTHGTPYDYWSVMHYNKNAFSNGNGLTITTIDPAYQDIIGQRYEVSTTDIKELNLLYNCNSTIAFLMHCSFSDGTMCEMTKCSTTSNGWSIVSQAAGQPSFDHTSLNSTMHSVGPSYFMHMSTATGQEGDSAWLETKTMVPNRECHVQCLQFYYFHSGHESDQLNIWLREFQDEHDLTGHRHLAAQITGGISIDDVNLSELECPHVTLQINEFDQLLGTTKYYYTPPQHSKEGYVYRFGAVVISDGSEAPFVQMLSGNFDDQLEWPVPSRQVVLQIVDQHPNIQLQMHKRVIFTSDLTPVANGSTLSCPEPKLMAIASPPTEQDLGPCSAR
ncbi:hypothetical protein WMY93_026501 [Mugilogobius chulae]|uniref:Metalloendopeptidase n=1 Tax=Mugilogobius chulae TaxID=88201 RepID=A0AAW0N9I5_9GOBI